MVNATSASICCLTLSLLLKNRVYFSNNTAYATSIGSYFSLQEAGVHPFCIVSPQTAEDVAAATRVLTTAHQPFAIRSGGHASFAGAANIQDGVTIDLTALSSIVVDQGEPPIVSVGAGATWGSVYSYLSARNLSVNGGRASGVGVGGLTIGGGISYFGPRFGWTCDMITNFEVVLANGSIINANNENADLLWALRGGGNNFGIVTRIDLQTFQQGELWGGSVIHPISTASEQITTLVTFNDPETYDEFSSLLTTFVFSGAGNISLIVNSMEYTKPVVDPPVFQSLLSLPSLANTQRITNISDLVEDTQIEDPNGFRQASATVTIKSTVKAINAAVNAWNASLPSIQEVSGIVWSLNMDLLPPVLYSRHAEANALGLNHERDPLIVIQLSMTWPDAKDDETIDMAARTLIATIEQDVGKLGALDSFIYLNYAAPWQEPIASYGEGHVDKLRRVQRKYDPHGVFTNLVSGGFKLP